MIDFEIMKEERSFRQNLKILISAPSASQSEATGGTGEANHRRPMRPTAQALVCFGNSDKGEENRTRVTPFEKADELGRPSSVG
jgi:hypothetical protein